MHKHKRRRHAQTYHYKFYISQRIYN